MENIADNIWNAYIHISLNTGSSEKKKDFCTTYKKMYKRNSTWLSLIPSHSHLLFPIIQHHGRDTPQHKNTPLLLFLVALLEPLFLLFSLSSLCIRVVTCQLCSPITITGIDITMTSLLPAEVSKTPWIKVPPTLPPSPPRIRRWSRETQCEPGRQAEREGGKEGELKGGW